MPSTFKRAHRFAIACSVVLTCAVAGLLFASAPALAASKNVYLSQFGTPIAEKAFSPENLAIAPDGDVYVALGSVVDVLSPSGALLATIDEAKLGESFYAFAVAVNSSGCLYVSDGEHDVIDKFCPSVGDPYGEYESQFNGSKTPEKTFYPGRLAIDSSGDIYVVDYNTGFVDEFNKSGTYLGHITGSETPAGSIGARGLATDPSSGDLYITDPEHEVVDVYSSSRVYLSQITGASVEATHVCSETPAGSFGVGYAIATDPSSGELYVIGSGSHVVYRFNAVGECLSQFDGSETPAKSFAAYSLAVDSSGEVYVADSEHEVVDIYSAPKSAVTKYTLGITKSGTGTVTCEVNASGSFVTCLSEYAEGTKLVVKETPEDSATFTEWSAGTGSATVCSGVKTSTCPFTLDADSTITATWTPPVTKYTLGITKSGTGTVTCEVNASGSFVTCLSEYAEGTKLVVKETPEDSATFTEWSAGTGSATVCSGVKTSTCPFTLDADSTITATWTPPVTKYTLGITKSGTGTVTCEVNASGSFVTCLSEYAEGTKLVVKETPEDSATFTEWSAGTGSATVCSGVKTSTCPFTLDADSTITATWTPPVTKYTLGITKSGTGTVTCEVNASGSFVTCLSEYAEGTKLVVKETPEDSATFTEWSAGTGSATVCSGVKTSTCPFTLDADSTITATWTPPVTKYTLGITKSGTGTVTCEVNASGSFVTCLSEYAEGTKLVVKETPEDSATFTEWSAGTGSATVCSGVKTSTCPFTLDADSTITATWTPPVTKYTLGITKSGTGTVTCEVNASGSFVTCLSEYAEGTKLVVKETPEDSATFTEWSAGTGSATVCSGVKTSTCPFTLDADSTITATWTPPVTKYTLGITKSGTGTVTCEVNASGSFVTCLSEYAEGTKLVVKETPEDSATFTEWSAGTGSATVCSGVKTSTCPFTLDADSTITATFNPAVVTEYPLTITKAGTGTGTVECDAGACAPKYSAGSKVTLTATAAAGSTFAGWSVAGQPGACTGTGSCEVTINAATSVTAWFNITPVKFPLTITKTGSGSGTVECNTGSGTGACAAEYPAGTEVTLIATAAAGSTFAGWSGACSGTGSCEVTISAAKSVTATFTKSQPPKGKLKVPASATVSGGKALLNLSCSDAGVCAGELKLTIQIKQGHKLKTVVIGRASYRIAAGQSETIKIKLSAVANQLLKQFRILEVTLTGPGGLHRTVKLKRRAEPRSTIEQARRLWRFDEKA